MDIQWLQRDFGIYVVNLFDTYHAAKLLGFAQLSLAFLLRHYCQVIADKQYQLADWRIRPVPEQMVNYAREDTHYLGYIYERMKKDLKIKGTGDNLLTAVWKNSRLVCLKRYRIPPITAESHLELYRLSKKIFNERQLFALKELFAWRDRVAREEDESTGFVLPKHMLLQIADVLPKEMQGILACCSPIPSLVRQHLLFLHGIVLKAREMPLATLQHHGQPLAIPKLMPTPLEQDTEDPLYCMHDLTHSQDIRDDLPTLLNPLTIESMATKSSDEFGVRVTVKEYPQALVFAESAESSIGRNLTTNFVSPYTRYMRVRALKSAEEAAEAERVEKLRQHFMEEVAHPTPDVQREAEAKEEEAEAVPHKKKKLPLKSQGLHKKKKKLGNVKRVTVTKATLRTPSSNSNSSPKKTVDSEEPSTSKSPNPGMKKNSLKRPAGKGAEYATAANFEPFDYSQVDYHAFKRSALREDGDRRGRGRGRGGNRRGGPGHSNNRIHRKGGQKSLTYSSK